MSGSPAVQQRDDDVVPCRRRGGRIVLEIGFVEPDDCLSVLPQRVGERCDGVLLRRAGGRAAQKSLLQAFLEPLDTLRKYEDEGKLFQRLALLEEETTLPLLG